MRVLDMYEDPPKESPREKLLREMRRFTSWGGERADGELVPESVATGLIRKVSKFGRRKEDGDVVRVDLEELVHIHGGYRPKFNREKETRKAFFFRGARVWRA